MKKLICVVLCAILGFGALTACGEKKVKAEIEKATGYIVSSNFVSDGESDNVKILIYDAEKKTIS